MNKTRNLPLKPKLIYGFEDTQKSIPLKSDKTFK